MKSSSVDFQTYREENIVMFAQERYLFFPEHYLNLHYTLPKPDLKTETFQKDWENIIKQQITLENSVLAHLGVTFEQLQKTYTKSFEKKKKKVMGVNDKISEQLTAIVRDFINSDSFANNLGDIKNTNTNKLFKENMEREKAAVISQLDLLIEELEKAEVPQNGNEDILNNVIRKAKSYNFIAREDLANENVSKREKDNIEKKKYTVLSMFESIKKSPQGTLNNVNSAISEKIVVDIINEVLSKSLNKQNGKTQSALSNTGSSGKKVKADIILTLNAEEKEAAGISAKISKGQSVIKIHSGGDLKHYIKWISAYKGTGSIVEFLNSPYFQFMLANEISSKKKGPAWEAWKEVIRLTLYIWIGNQFMSDNGDVAEEILGGDAGSYNIAFLTANNQLYKVSEILINLSKSNFSKYATPATEKAVAGFVYTNKHTEISKLREAEAINPALRDEPYPASLIQVGREGTESILDRITYTINMSKNLLSGFK